MDEKRFFGLKKWMPVAIALMMLFSGFYILIAMEEQAEGAGSLGTITVTSGTRTFSGVDYILDGNITVDGSSSRLIFNGCNLTISQDVGIDGRLGGNDDHIYSIQVLNGGYLEFSNSFITTQTDQLHPYFLMEFISDGSGSTIDFINSIVEGPAEIKATDGGRIDATGSIFKELDDQSDLSFDIDGDGSTDDDLDYNDDGPLFSFHDGSRGLFKDSQLRDTFSFSTSTRDGRMAGNITLDGAGTNVTFINSFLDIDFETNRSTGTHNMLKVTDGAIAHIVGSSFNVSAADYTYPAVLVEGSGSKAIYYRWVITRVLDGVGIPVSSQTVNVYRVEGSTNRLLTSSYLTSDLTDYTGRTPATWSSTDNDGWSFIPVITDVFRTTSMPNSNSYPDFRVDITQGTEVLSAHTSFNNYPKVPDQGEAVGIVAEILGGTADTTHGYSDMGGPFNFKQYIVTPQTSSFYSGHDVDLTLSSPMSMKGTSAIVGGQFYPSYYAFDGHLIIRSGGELTINDTYVNFLTDGSPGFILIEDGGALNLNNVTLGSTTLDDLFIYVIGSNGPEMSLDGGSIEVANIVARDSAQIDLDGSLINGSLNLYGSNVALDLKAGSVNLEDLFAVDCDLMIGGGDIVVDDLDWNGVSFSAEDATFSNTLDVDGSASLTNVSFNGELPEGRTNWLKAVGSGVIERSWWIKAQVQDSVQNSVAGSNLHVQRIDGPLNVDVGTYRTDDDGMVKFSLVEEELRSTGRTYLGNYRMNASYNNIVSTPLSAVLSGAGVDAIVVLPGGPNILPELIWTNGTLIDGFPVEIMGQLTNDGQFDSDPFTASIMIDGESVHLEYIDGLAAGSSTTIGTTWITTEGEVTVSLEADVGGDVAETDEDDNLLDQMNTIGIGPDYVVDLFVPPVVWAYNTTDQLEVFITNDGEEDPEQNSFYVNLTWSDAMDSGVIQSYIDIDYIQPGGRVFRTVNWTPSKVGTIDIVASIISKYDRSTINSIDLITLEVLSLPDLKLVLNSFTVDVPDPVTVNTSAMVSFSVENTGDLAAEPFMVTLYDGIISNETKIDIDATVPGLSPDEQMELQFQWFAGPPIGIHDLIVVIDAYDVVREQVEMNNIVMFPVRVDTPPDLTFTSNIGVSPSVVTEGMNATFWVTVRNDGNTMARNAKIRFSLDSDTNVIETVELDLLPGQERNISIGWIAVRTGEESGFRTMFIVADPIDEIMEPDEDNNLRSVDVKVISKPDLYMGVNDIQFSPSTDIDIGEEVTISATVRNSGETPAKDLFIRFYDGDPLEGGKIISWRETQPSVSIKHVPAGGFRWANVTWTPTTGGDHDIYIILDLVNTIDESDEDNNKIYWDVYVQTLPDIELTNISLYQGDFMVNSAGVGSDLVINATIGNSGDTTSPSFRIRFYNGDFESDPEPVPIGVGMTYLAGTLPGRSSMFIEMPWTVDYPKGIRTIIVLVDLLEGVEQTTTNNRIYYQVEVFDIEDVPEIMPEDGSLMVSTGYSGIDIDLEYEEPIAYYGMNLSIDMNLTNIGGKAASNTTITFMAYNETDSWIEHQVNIPFLESNGTDVISGFWNLVNLGNNRMRIIVDPDNTIREFDEGNNVITLELEVVEAPDLSIELIRDGDAYNFETGQFDMKKDKEYEVTFRITNNGNFSFQDLGVRFNDILSLADGESSIRNIDLLPYQEQLITYRVEPAGSVGDTKVFSVSVDDQGIFYESDVSNNEASAIILIKEADQPSNVWVWILAIVLIFLVIGGIVGFFVYKKYQTKDMAKCSNCGGLVEIDMDICPHCGVEFSEELECECGEIIPEGATECPACHRPVKGEAAASEEDEESPEDGEEEGEEEIEELEEDEEELDEIEEEAEEIPSAGEDVPEVEPEAGGEEELAECFECGALIPVSAPICPHCGAVFE